MPGMYPAGEYDLAGFAVGVVEKSKIIDGSTILPGDVVIGIPSRRAFQRLLAGAQDHRALAPDLDAPFDEVDGKVADAGRRSWRRPTST